MKHTVFSAAALLALTAGNASAAGLDEAKVNALIGQYLKDHPEAIIESLQAYQVKEEAQRGEKQAEAVRGVLPEFQKKKMHYGEAGNPKGDVLIVEFFDYNCPACKMMFASIEQLLKDDMKVRVLFVELPIFGPISDENAKISMAVHALDASKYFRFHEAVMRQKGKITPEIMLSVAEGLGFKKDTLKAEAAKPIYTQLIEKDREIAATIQATGTPALIVGDTFHGGALDISQLKEVVAKAREAAAKPAK